MKESEKPLMGLKPKAMRVQLIFEVAVITGPWQPTKKITCLYRILQLHKQKQSMLFFLREVGDR
jgi:hypothetical protein